MSRITVVLIALVTIASCTKPKDLEFIDVQNVRMVKWGLKDSEVGLDIRFFNPNNQRVQIKDADAKVYVNSTYMGDTRMDTTIPVPRRDTFSLPLVLHVKTISSVARILESFSDSTVNIRVEGTVKMGKAGIFKTFPVNYNKVQRVSDLMNGQLTVKAE